MNEEELKIKYINIRGELGKIPSIKEFLEKANISEYQITKLYRTYNNLVKACGDNTKEFSFPKSDPDKILFKYGELTRKIGEKPAISHWVKEKVSPSVNAVKNWCKWSELPDKFIEFASGKEEWNDIIDFFPKQKSSEKIFTHIQQNNLEVQENESIDPELLKFIPPVVQDLIELSANEEKKYREFENKVNLVFEMLGFDVEYCGQGTGRKPDGIARERQNHYAILIDAKSRKDSYKIGTEDRKFIEYIKTFSDEPENKGFSNKYFFIVSSKFSSLSEKYIQNIKIETGVSTTLLTSKLLLKLLAKKIQKPRLFDLKKFREKLLVDGGEISENKIYNFLKGK